MATAKLLYSVACKQENHVLSPVKDTFIYESNGVFHLFKGLQRMGFIVII